MNKFFYAKNCYKTDVDAYEPNREINTFELHIGQFLYFIIDSNKKRSIVDSGIFEQISFSNARKINGPSFNSIQIATGKIRIYEPLEGFNLFKFQIGKPGLNPDLPHGFSCNMYMRTYPLGLRELLSRIREFYACIAVKKPISRAKYFVP